ncbi:MAG: C4-type zinc ribbon domain-containing protein [Treponema sp.]|nr:C4-type zinc ribbon domain-containing protein [Treponema sp.]
MTMEDVIEKLRSLQEILSQKIKLEQAMVTIPKALIDKEDTLSRLKKTFIDKNLDLKKSQEIEAGLKNNLAEAESMREKSEKNMDVISTQREYEALDKEIRDASEWEQQYRKDLQKEERFLAELDEQIKQYTALIEQQEKDLEECRESTERQLTEKRERITELEAEEKALVPGLDPEVLFKFERIIRSKMEGIVAIKGGVCTGCHMVLPVQFANMVHQGGEIVFCPYCSRILFYEETEEGEESFFDAEDSGTLSDLDDIEEDDYDEDDEEEEKANIDYEE